MRKGTANIRGGGGGSKLNQLIVLAKWGLVVELRASANKLCLSYAYMQAGMYVCIYACEAASDVLNGRQRKREEEIKREHTDADKTRLMSQ